SVDDAIMEAGALPFDLERGSLIRATLYKVGREQFVLVVVVHHAVFDGWSLGILVSDFKQHYCQPGLRHASRESAESLSYADYAEWQRRQWNNGVWQAQLSYWVEMLREAPGRLDLPTDRPRAAVQRFNGETLHFEWPETLSAHIRTQCLELNITPFMFFEALFAVLLHRYTGQVDIVIGTPVANRRQPATQALMGPVANSVAIRNRLDPARTWSGLLAQVRSAVLGAYCNQDVPFEKVVEALQPIRSLTHSPLFQAMIVMQ